MDWISNISSIFAILLLILHFAQYEISNIFSIFAILLLILHFAMDGISNIFLIFAILLLILHSVPGVLSNIQTSSVYPTPRTALIFTVEPISVSFFLIYEI